MFIYDVKDIFEKNGFHLDDEEDEHDKFFLDCCKDYYDAAFENKYGDELDKIEETVDKRFNEFASNCNYRRAKRVKENTRRMAELDDRIEETRQKIADINARINMINGYMEHERKKEQPFMLTVDDDKPKTKKTKDKEKKPEEMTLLEKLNQRSDAGILADKFTNFLSVNSLQK